jgi:hypothetical protein
MVLCDDVVEVVALTACYRRTAFLVLAFDGGFIGVTPVNRDGLRDPVTADRFCEKPERGVFLSVFYEQDVNGLTGRIHRTISIPPLAFHTDGRFIPPPAGPHGPLAVVEHRFEWRAVVDHLPVVGRVIHLYPTFLHARFDMARAQWLRPRPAPAGQNTCLGKWGALKLVMVSPSWLPPASSPREIIRKNVPRKTCDRTLCRPVRASLDGGRSGSGHGGKSLPPVRGGGHLRHEGSPPVDIAAAIC